MPSPTADQGLTLPIAADAADVPSVLTTLAPQWEQRMVKVYADAADRAARNPTIVAGEFCYLTAEGRWDKAVVGGTPGTWWEAFPQWVRKANETQVVNNSTVMVNDSALVLPVQANARYQGEYWLLIDSGTTGDFKVNFTLPAGGTLLTHSIIAVDTALAFGQRSSIVAADLTAGGASIGTFVVIRGQLQLTTVATAGNAQMQWAQNAAEAVNTRIKTNSWLRLDRVG
jgi:hypothetical protein